jgi:hypothetical protein
MAGPHEPAAVHHLERESALEWQNKSPYGIKHASTFVTNCRNNKQLNK